MKIVDNRITKENKVRFKDLPLGTVYADIRNHVCIKINHEEDGDQNCLYFCEDGWWKLATEDEDEFVTVLNAKLVIEN